MSKKRKLIFGIAVAVAWITVLTLAAVFLLPKLLDQPPQVEEGNDAEQTLELAMDGLVSGGTEEPVLLGVDGKPAPIRPATGIAGLISAKLQYEIVSVETEGESGVATLRITAPDTLSLVTQAVAGMESYDEALLTERMQQLLAGEFATLEYSVEVELVLLEQNWCIISNSEFSDAITGGMISHYVQLQTVIMEALAGGEGE